MNEHQTIEWKESWRDEYLKWICGFANAQGGTLVIGKNDRGKAVGIKDARKLLQDIPNKVRDILGIFEDVILQEAETPVKTPVKTTVKTPGKTGEVSGVTSPVTAQVTDVDNAQWDRVLRDITRVFRLATAQVTAQVAAQVGHLCREPRAAREIMQHLHLRHWKTFQANYLGPLLQDGLLERTIPDKPTSRLQKYRLTAKGAALLAGMEKP